MTEAAFFVDLETGEIRSKIVRSVAPQIRVRFNTFLKCTIGFVRDEVAEALADGTGVTLVVKPELGHTAAAVALDVTATVTGTGTGRRYEMQALVTGDVLSDLLNGLDEGVFSLQVAWGTEGAAGYGISEPLEIVVVNAYVRMGDELPDPTGDAAWVLLKETFPQGTPDEVERTLEFDLGGGGVTDHGELTGLEDDDHPQYLNEDRGDARYAPVGALVDGDTVGFLLFQNGGVRLLDAEGDRFLQVGFNQSLSANRVLFFAVNDANRTINLSGDLTVAAAATVSGTNTGDVTLAGVPDYLTRVGQVITRALINLASHVPGFWGRPTGGPGLSAAGAAGNVLTSDGTDWTSAAPASGGSTSQWIGSGEWIPRTTAGVGIDSTETTAADNNIDYLTFDAGVTAEGAQWIGTLPSNYSGGTVTARFYWTAASGSGTVIWRLSGRALADDDALDTATGTAQSVTDTLLAAEDMHITSATPAVTVAGSPAANVPIIFTISRDSATDTLAVDARLIGVQINW